MAHVLTRSLSQRFTLTGTELDRVMTLPDRSRTTQRTSARPLLGTGSLTV